MDDATWFAEHTAYLATAEWAFRRGQVLNRDGYRCQAHLHGCNGDASQVHHLTYKHWRNEPLFDLIAVCWVCHEQITEMDRANRPPEARLRAHDPGEFGMDIPGVEESTSMMMSTRIRQALREHGKMGIWDINRVTGIDYAVVSATLKRMSDTVALNDNHGNWTLLDPIFTDVKERA